MEFFAPPSLEGCRPDAGTLNDSRPCSGTRTLCQGWLAYARRLGPQEIFVALNTSGSAQILPPRRKSRVVSLSVLAKAYIFNPYKSIVTH